MDPVISVNNLSKHFISRPKRGLFLMGPPITKRAVDDISFQIAKGEAVAFLGPNGAGKTTTTKMMVGLIYPTSGKLSVLGHAPFDRTPAYLRRIGLVMGNKAGLNWDLTPRQSFRLVKEIYGISDTRYQERLHTLTGLLDVKDHLDTQLRRLSLGERMKMELIGAILHDPEILFLDEPTIGLDILTKKNIRLFLRDIQKSSGTTLVLTSHDMDDIEQVCDRVIIINDGKKVYDDALVRLTDQHRKERFVRLFFDVRPSPNELSALGGELVEDGADGLLFRVPSSHMVQLVAAAAAREDLIDMRVESVPLEEIIGEIFRQT